MNYLKLIESLLPISTSVFAFGYGSFSESITFVNKWEKRATDFIFGIILHLKTVNQINIISFCLGKRDTGSGPLYP